MAEEAKKLSPELDGKFKMKRGFAPGSYRHGNVQVDLSSCSVEEADALIKAGSKVIERVEKTTDDTKAKK